MHELQGGFQDLGVPSTRAATVDVFANGEIIDKAVL